MKRLSRGTLDAACAHIMNLGRPLEKALCTERFCGGSRRKVLEELLRFQNGDGGFGKGMEPDFRLPLSSPMATYAGTGQLSELDDLEGAKEPIKRAALYYEASFDEERMGWYVAPREVNDYPHAPWWHFHEQEGMTVIDKNWGNPSAGITAFLYKYREYIKDVQPMYTITETTTITITINPNNQKIYTHAHMPDGKYHVKAWLEDINPQQIAPNYNLAYKKLDVIKGITSLDEIEVSVKGSLYDDIN
jgi:hypothetical protein